MKIIFKHKTPNTTDRIEYIDEGSVIIENYNETLDSATIRISHITEPLTIEPYDKVVLVDEETPKRFADRYMDIDTYTETMESLDPVIYSYEIQLFSETKELEGIMLPCLSITQLKGQTHRTLMEYITRYFELYCPKIRQQYVGYNAFVYKYTLGAPASEGHPLMGTRFAGIECPEFQWNNPTFREVLTDLMMVADCIPVIRNNVIDYIDLSQKKNAIDESKVNYIQRSQSSEDYVSELKVDLRNVLQTSLDGVDTTVTKVEYIPFKSKEDNYLLTSNNVILKTQMPILKLKHLWLGFGPTFSYTQVGDTPLPNPFYFFVVKDLCNLKGKYDSEAYSLISEYKEWITKKVARNMTEINTNRIEDIKDFQNLTGYYTRGGYEISGLGEPRLEASGISKLTVQYLMDYIANLCIDDIINKFENDYEITINSIDGDDNFKYYNPFFKIEYETLAESVFTASKGDYPNNKRTVIDNQTNSYVDAYKQGFMEYQKANRLGNKQLLINARYEDDYADLIKIGDYYNDSIIYQTQYQVYKNHIEVNAIATKDYILKDYFTGVKAKIRSWRIADGEEALSRHELNKYYLEFSMSSKNDCITAPVSTSYFLAPLRDSYAIQPLKYCVVKTYDSDDKEYPKTGDIYYYSGDVYYSVDFSKRIVGNSVVFSFGFEDNYQAGISYQITKFSTTTYQITGNQISGGIPLMPLRYVDDNGEFVYIDYYFTDDIKINTTDGLLELTNGLVCDDVIVTDVYDSVYRKPMIEDTEVDDFIKISHPSNLIYKDNKEILKMSTQFEVCSDTHDIVFTKKFLQLQQCVRELNTSELTFKSGSNSATLHLSNWIQTGGPQSFTVTANTADYVGVDDHYKATKYHIEQLLYGKTLSQLSITDTYSGESNTVTFDNNYTDPGLGNCGRFKCEIYSGTFTSQTATVTYTRSDAETPFWTITENIDTGLIGCEVEDISVSGIVGADTVRGSYNPSSGEITVYVKTFNQPTGNISITVTYRYRLSDGSTVSNPLTIYKQTSGELDFKNPTLANASEISDIILLTEVIANKSSSITLLNTDVEDTDIIYIVSGNEKKDENIILAFKGTNKIYLNMLKDRDDRVYDSDGNVINTI